MIFFSIDTEENPDRFLEDMNKFHPNLRFIYEDLRPIDGHQDLRYDFCHAEHIKRSTVFSQTL